MKLPITQEHIDEAMRRIEQRRLNPVFVQLKGVIAKPKKKKRKYIPKEMSIDRRMDYAIWKDKD